MPTKSFYKPCCKRFESLAINYADLVASDDHALRAMANLLFCIEDLEMFDPETLYEVSHFISSYLDRKLAREHYLFGRSVKKYPIDHIELGTELHRVHSRLKEAGVV